MSFLKTAVLVSFMFCSSMVFAQPVADFSFKDINGRQHKFSEYKGKWVIVNYWATYCGPCLAEIPVLRNIAAQYRGKVEVLGMDAGETPDHEMKQFMRQRGINYTVVPTQDSSMFALGLIYGVPTTFVVSPQGQIVDTHMGVVTMQRMQRFLGRPPNRQQQQRRQQQLREQKLRQQKLRQQQLRQQQLRRQQLLRQQQERQRQERLRQQNRTQ